MESELLRAVSIASAPAGLGGASTTTEDLRAQAMAYLQQLQANTHECWQAAWNVFAARAEDAAAAPRYGDNERMFAINLVQDFLENR